MTPKARQLKAVIKAKLAAEPIKTVQEVCMTCCAKTDEHADMVFGYALNDLEKRMPEADFLAFVTELEKTF